MSRRSDKIVPTLLISTILAILCFTGISAYTGIMPTYSEGERTGVVTKLSRKGLLLKSLEGSMNLGAAGADAGGVMVPQAFDFSVKDQAVATKIAAAAATGQRVTLTYQQWWIKPAHQDTQYTVVGVR